MYYIYAYSIVVLPLLGLGLSFYPLFLLLLLTSLEAAAAVCIQSVLCSICFSDQRCTASPSGLSQQQPEYYCFTMVVVWCTSGRWVGGKNQALIDL